MNTLKGYLKTVYLPSKLDIKPRSAQQLEITVSMFSQWNGGDVLLSELTPELVTDFLRALGTNRSPRTVNNKRQGVVTLWRHAARKGLAPKFDPDDIPRRKLPRRIPTAWTPDEMRLIVSHLRRPWLKTLTIFIYETGTRLSSACLLTWDDWDLQRRMMRLPWETAKTGCEQCVRVSPRTATAIEFLRANSTGPRIFPCPNDKRPIWKELKRSLRAAGLPHTRRDLFQKIRRTNATLTAAATSVETASRQLGHTSTRMTLASYIDVRMLPSVHGSDVLPPLS